VKDRLLARAANPSVRSDFFLGQLGAALMFPENTAESCHTAARTGTGIIECDVTFTQDMQLVCRRARTDLHTSTTIPATPLASTSGKTPFTPAAGDTKANAECRTSDLTLDEVRSLKGKGEGTYAGATTVEADMDGTAPFRTYLYRSATLVTHAGSIALISRMGGKFAPELKAQAVEMPHDGMTQEMYAQVVQGMIDDCEAAGIPGTAVWAQLLNLCDILYWIKAKPAFGAQAVDLDDRPEAFEDDEGEIDPMKPETFKSSMQELAVSGEKYIALQPGCR
jgi:glycerophosphoryl diester phosphodiesterase